MTEKKAKKPKVPTRKELEDQIARLVATQHGYWKERDEARSDAKTVREEVQEVRTQFADLKQRLHDSEVANARLQGYLDRVHDDDIVRDGMVEIEDERGKRTVPKRPPPLQRIEPDTRNISDHMNFTGRNKPRVHWTSY